MTDSGKSSRTPRFERGVKVRVKSGVTVSGLEDIPLGGWTGTIKELEPDEAQVDYRVEWNRRTLDAMHPVYRKRCERGGLDPETMWLHETDVEPDDGTLVPIDQPTKIVTPPLSEKDQDDRVRKAIGLTHDDPLPEVSLETLLAYHRYLTANLRFPITAYCGVEQVGRFAHKRATLTLTGLLDPARGGLYVEVGLVGTGRVRDHQFEVPLAEVELGKKNPDFKLISDYAYWFYNWPSWDESDLDPEDEDQAIGDNIAPSPWLYAKAAFISVVAALSLGTAIGAAIGALNGAGLAALIGGILLGMIGTLILCWYGSISGAVNRFRYGGALGVVLGSLGGGLIGVVAGLTVVALPWSLLGLVAGMFSGPYVLPQRRRKLVSLRGASLGTCGGVLISAIRSDQARATAGAVTGAITGLVVVAGLVLLFCGAAYLIRRATPESDLEAEAFEIAVEDEERGGVGLPRRRF